MTLRALGLLPGLALAAGCTVTAVDLNRDGRQNNRCGDGDLCPAGQLCSAGVCETASGTLDALLISATPPSDSVLPHLTLLTPLDGVTSRGGSADLELLEPVRIKGSLRLPTGYCTPRFDSGDNTRPILASQDGTLPVTVTLALRQRLLGLSQQVYYTKTGGLTNLGGYAFGVRVPAGEYDVYLVPPAKQLDECEQPCGLAGGPSVCTKIPPQLYRNFPLGVGENTGSNGVAPFQLSNISTLRLVVRWPHGSTLDGWTADIIEPSGGNPISNQVVLGNSTPVGGGTAVDYRVPLAYSKVLGSTGSDSESSGDLLRLRPPTGGVEAPTILLDRTRLGLLQTDPNEDVRLTAFTRLPNAVSVHGQLLRRATGTSAAGRVTFISTEIYGVDAGIFATYETVVEPGANGLISVSLPPGKYRVRGEPPLQSDLPAEERLAATETTWDVPADLPIQFGKVVELPPIPDLSGRTNVPGATVRAVPSARNVSPFDAAFGNRPLLPRASSGLVNERGSFALDVDPGLFDVSVQAPEELGFGWFVRPGVEMTNQAQDLGFLSLPLPSVLSGNASVRLESGSVALSSAAIRAYVYLNKDLAYTREPAEAVAVVQVAETRADSAGRFRLLLPESIDAAK